MIFLHSFFFYVTDVKTVLEHSTAYKKSEGTSGIRKRPPSEGGVGRQWPRGRPGGSALLVAVKLVRWSLGARKEKSWLSRRPVAVGRGGEGLYVGQCSNMGLHTYCSLEDIPHLQNFFRMSWYCFVLSCPCVLPFFKFTPLVRSCRTRVRLLLSSMTCPIC